MTGAGLLGITLAAIFLGTASSALAVTEVQDPSGKTVMLIDHDKVTDPAGKLLMSVDDDKINDASGKLVIYCAGDIFRDQPSGNVLLIKDGRNLMREVGGTKLLYVDGRNLMRGDRSGKPLYHLKGDEPDTKTLLAVIYVVMPEIFGASKEADAKMVAEQGKASAASDASDLAGFADGTFKIDNYRSNDATAYAGTVTLTKAGDVVAMDFKFTKGEGLSGVAVQRGDELWAAVGPAGTVGLAVYKVDGGKLTGTWYNASGKPETFGSENLTGSETLGGVYKITEAKAPVTLAPYTGTLTLEATDKKFDGTAPLFLAAWDLGGYKARGVGFSSQGSLAIATSSAADFSIIHFKMKPKEGYLNGQFYSANKVVGLWILSKKK